MALFMGCGGGTSQAPAESSPAPAPAVWGRVVSDDNQRGDSFTQVLATHDGNLLAIGSRGGLGGPYDAGGWLFKFKVDGSLLWKRSLNPAGSALGYACTVVETPEGGCVVFGSASLSSVWMCKLDFKGDLEWQKDFSVPGAIIGVTRCTPTPDGGLVLAGVQGVFASKSNLKGFLWKLGADGTPAWRVACKVAGGLDPNTKFEEVIAMPDGGVTACGSYIANAGVANPLGQALVLRVGPDGSELWSRCLGSTSKDSRAHGVALGKDGSLLIAGETGDGWTTSQGVFLRLDAQGTLRGQLGLGLLNSLIRFRKVLTLPDGNTVLAGVKSAFAQSDQDAVLVRLDGADGVKFTRALGQASAQSEEILDLLGLEDGSFVLAGTTDNWNTPKVGGALLLRVSGSGQLGTLGHELITTPVSLALAPLAHQLEVEHPEVTVLSAKGSVQVEQTSVITQLAN